MSSGSTLGRNGLPSRCSLAPCCSPLLSYPSCRYGAGQGWDAPHSRWAETLDTEAALQTSSTKTGPEMWIQGRYEKALSWFRSQAGSPGQLYEGALYLGRAGKFQLSQLSASAPSGLGNEWRGLRKGHLTPRCSILNPQHTESSTQNKRNKHWKELILSTVIYHEPVFWSKSLTAISMDKIQICWCFLVPLIIKLQRLDFEQKNEESSFPSLMALF